MLFIYDDDERTYVGEADDLERLMVFQPAREVCRTHLGNSLAGGVNIRGQWVTADESAASPRR
jgi:hypothetical protein